MFDLKDLYKRYNFSWKSERNKNKFNNKKITVNKLSFDSKHEQKIFTWIKSLERVSSVDLHFNQKIIFNEVVIGSVVPDFKITRDDGKIFFADAKVDVTETDLSKWKFRCFLAYTKEKIYCLPREENLFLKKFNG